VAGDGRSYKVKKADAGRQIVCSLEASNDGGYATAPFLNTTSKVKIPRLRLPRRR
jgi:hypothetical protein